jgi:23S rRNA pseudouridine1911/1915/1917 synthase
MRLDLAVSRRFGLSRRAARDAIRAGRLDVGGTARDEPGLDVPDDADLRFDPNRPERRRVRSRLNVIVEDPLFLIVDKPAGLLTVQTAEHEKDTLVARALSYLQHRYRRRAWVGVVHRLDKETSGSLVFARTREALRGLQQKFRAHRIDREYVAIVEGDVRSPGVFEAPLVADRGDLRRGVARPGEAGKRAVTRYRPLERFGRATLVSVQLETGRTHQIRVHFAEGGHTILGDSVYRRRAGPPPPVEAPRQMLHARVLGFSHPKTGEPVRAVSPIPADFSGVLEKLRRRPTKIPGPGLDIRAARAESQESRTGTERSEPQKKTPRRGGPAGRRIPSKSRN